MNPFEKHPMVPELSEEHDDLVSRLISIQDRAGNPRLKEKLWQAAADNEADKEALQLLDEARRTDVGDIIIFTRVARGDEPDYSPNTPPPSLKDEEIVGLISRITPLISVVEQGPAPWYTDPKS